MIPNYLKIIIRTFKKNRGLTFIHLIGLSLGLTACLLIAFFIQHERSFDRYHQHADHTYRFATIEQSENGIRKSGGTPFPFAEAIRIDLPDIGLVTQIHHTDDASLTLANGNQFLVEDLIFADSNFFSVFDFEVTVGDPIEILASPGKAILTTSTAKKYFGNEDPIGQELTLNNNIKLEVSGLITDIPAQTHLPASIIISIPSLSDDFVGLPVRNWGTTAGGATYVVLPENAEADDFTSPLQIFADKYLNSEGSGFKHSLALQPLTQIHFQPEFRSNSPVQPILPRYLWIFGSIGVLILLSASFNFINLATAQAIRRSREVGVRKVLGASKKQLVIQFLGEALLLSLAAGIIAVLLAQASLPYINQLLGLQIGHFDTRSPINWMVLLGLPITVGLFSGFYPAFFLARYQPVQALSGRAEIGRNKNITLRRTLVLFQFAITLLLLVGTAVVSQQVSYMREKDLGFAKEGIVMLDVPNQQQTDQLRNQFLQNANISQVSFSLGAPTSENNISTSFRLKSEGEERSQRVALKLIDHNYAYLFDLPLVAGRWITESECSRSAETIPSEERSYFFMVNETLIKKLGYRNPEEAIGQVLVTGINNIEAPIIGITEDFHGRSLHNEIEPILFLHFPRLNYRAAVKVNMSNIASTLSYIETTWGTRFPDDLFTHTFLDESIARLYENEQQIFRLFQFFSLLAIVIGALGLLGLVSYITELKTKEIGIRKILGASVSNLILLVTREFILLTVLAALLAIPLGVYLMNMWHENFAYHVTIGVGVFLVALIVAFTIIITTVGLQALRAASANPINSLRDE